MPHKRIPLESGRMYHIWTHANGEENLYHENQNYTYFLEKYSYHIEPVAGTYAYCFLSSTLGHPEILQFTKSVILIRKKDSGLEGWRTSVVCTAAQEKSL